MARVDVLCGCPLSVVTYHVVENDCIRSHRRGRRPHACMDWASKRPAYRPASRLAPLFVQRLLVAAMAFAAYADNTDSHSANRTGSQARPRPRRDRRPATTCRCAHWQADPNVLCTPEYAASFQQDRPKPYSRVTELIRQVVLSCLMLLCQASGALLGEVPHFWGHVLICRSTTAKHVLICRSTTAKQTTKTS